MAFIEREVGIAIAATAATMSPKVRDVVRRGAVYGIAGAMRAGDVVWGTARGAARGAQEGFTGGNGGAGGGESRGGSASPATTGRRTTRARGRAEQQEAAT
jgi:hypothetical protein